MLQSIERRGLTARTPPTVTPEPSPSQRAMEQRRAASGSVEGSRIDHVLRLRESRLVAVGEPVAVEFQEGRLGLQIADCNGRVLVTSFENELDGRMGQAQRCGKIQYASQVVAVAGQSTDGLSMKQVRRLVAKASRPLEIKFQPMKLESGDMLVAPPPIVPSPRSGKFRRKSTGPASDRMRILECIRRSADLEEVGDPFRVRFHGGVIGLKIASAGERVLVSGFEKRPDGRPAQAERVNCVEVSDQVIEVAGEPCDGLDFRGVARMVAAAERPVIITFQPVKLAVGGRRVYCDQCGARGWADAKYCFSCGAKVDPRKTTRPVVLRKEKQPEAGGASEKQEKTKAKDDEPLLDLSFG